MTFQDVRDFQDSLIDMGIGGNDLALYVDFKPVYRYMSGWQDMWKGIPVNHDTMYKMFSMTKPITCTAALQLFEKGKYLLNEPVADYLPEFKHMKVRVGKDPKGICTPDMEAVEVKDAVREIEIQHLCQRGAGLDYNLKSDPLLKLAKETDSRFTTAQFIRAVAESPLMYEPGEHWAYSIAHDVIGRLIEVWSGMSFGEYLKQNIFDPLGMETACFHPTEEQASHYMVRCGFSEDGKTFIPGDQTNPYQTSPNMESGGAGLFSTARDYAKLGAVLSFGHSGILNRRTVDFMRENGLSPFQRTGFDWESLWGYGYGNLVRCVENRNLAGTLATEGAFGWDGWTGTYVLVDPAEELSITLFLQRANSGTTRMSRSVVNAVYGDL